MKNEKSAWTEIAFGNFRLHYTKAYSNDGMLVHVYTGDPPRRINIIPYNRLCFLTMDEITQMVKCTKQILDVDLFETLYVSLRLPLLAALMGSLQ